MIKRSILFFYILFTLFFGNLRAATCVATKSDDWEDPTTWSCGRLPTCGDSVVIPALRIVTVTTQLDLSGCGSPIAINVFGTLTFNNGKKMFLPCGSLIYVQVGGIIIGGGGGGSSNLIDICSNTAWTAGAGPVTGPSTVSSGGVSPGLPVELLYFTAVDANQKVKLNWATATETNNKEFEIQRSTDGINFEKVSVLSAQNSGNSLITLYYENSDPNPYGGTSYYRLKQIDKNGDFKLYPATSVTIGNKAWVHIVPNPTSHTLIIETGDDYLEAKIQVMNLLGEEMLNTTLSSYKQTLDVSSLSNGTYYILIDNGLELSRNKIVIQK